MNHLAPLTGPKTGQIVLLHGYGSNGEDLIELARRAQVFLPTVSWTAPDAPMIAPNGGRMWYPLVTRDVDERAEGVELARPWLDAFLDGREDGTPTVLVGFSQGTIVALHVGLRRQRLAGIVGFSGILGVPERLGEATIHPPVALIHGSADEVIPAAASERAAEQLRAAGIPVSLHISPGVGHTVDPEGLFFGIEAIRSALAEPGSLKG
ncbi:MAG: hypothetical protein C4320_07675 [Armatimonadota bacterium]